KVAHLCAFCANRAQLPISAAIRPRHRNLRLVDHGEFRSCPGGRFRLLERGSKGTILVNGFRAFAASWGWRKRPGGCGALALIDRTLVRALIPSAALAAPGAFLSRGDRDPIRP